MRLKPFHCYFLQVAILSEKTSARLSMCIHSFFTVSYWKAPPGASLSGALLKLNSKICKVWDTWRNLCGTVNPLLKIGTYSRLLGWLVTLTIWINWNMLILSKFTLLMGLQKYLEFTKYVVKFEYCISIVGFYCWWEEILLISIKIFYVKVVTFITCSTSWWAWRNL